MKLLSRLAANPSLTQVELARETGLTRSAISQTLRRLEKKMGLAIRSTVDYGYAGMHLFFGWAGSTMKSTAITKFLRWIRTYRYTTLVLDSALTSEADRRVYFECTVPASRRDDFIGHLRLFARRPYQLSLHFDTARSVSSHVNLADFDGCSWASCNGFKLEAAIDAARQYADVLPLSYAMHQSDPRTLRPIPKLLLSLLESKYRASATDALEFLRNQSVAHPTTRTLQRHLAYLRSNAVKPYLHVDKIGLNQHVLVCIEDAPFESPLSLHAHATTLPRARLIAGQSLTVMQLDLPDSTDWLMILNALASLSQGRTRLWALLPGGGATRKGLVDVLSCGE